MKLRAVLVTASRELPDGDWDTNELIGRALTEAAGDDDTWRLLIHGDARGGDTIVSIVAGNTREWTCLPMPVPELKWARIGLTAGKLRNRLMVLVLRCLRWCGYECLVLAFPTPESRGTWHCVGVAKRAGFEVRVYRVG